MLQLRSYLRIAVRYQNLLLKGSFSIVHWRKFVLKFLLSLIYFTVRNSSLLLLEVLYLIGM